jgi:hypothetical protein
MVAHRQTLGGSGKPRCYSNTYAFGNDSRSFIEDAAYS